MRTRWFVVIAGFLAAYGFVFAAFVGLNGYAIDLRAAVRVPIAVVGLLGVVVAGTGIVVAIFWRANDVGGALVVGAIASVLVPSSYVGLYASGHDPFEPADQSSSTNYPLNCGAPSPAYRDLVVVVTEGELDTSCDDVHRAAMEYVHDLSRTSRWSCRKVSRRVVARCNNGVIPVETVFEIRSVRRGSAHTARFTKTSYASHLARCEAYDVQTRQSTCRYSAGEPK